MQIDEIPVGLAKNIIGQKYGRLTVLYRTTPPNNITAKKPKSFWKCQCECGNQCVVSVDRLNSGNTKSCGCLSKEKASKRFSVDITNQKFGNLTAIQRDTNKPAGNVYWLCKCDCGNPILESIDGTSLRTGKKTNCSLCRPRSKGEEKIKEILLLNNISFIQEKSFEDCRFPDSNRLARFDFFVDNKYIIEFDGRQHLKVDNSSGWQPLEYIQGHDQFKNNYCKNHNIPIIRIPYTHLNKIQLNDLLLQTSNFII